MVGLKRQLSSHPLHSLSSPGPQWLSLVPCVQPLSLAPAQWIQQDRGPNSRDGSPDSVEEFSQQSACQAKAPLTPAKPPPHSLTPSLPSTLNTVPGLTNRLAQQKRKKSLETSADIQAFNQACFVVV